VATPLGLTEVLFLYQLVVFVILHLFSYLLYLSYRVQHISNTLNTETTFIYKILSVLKSLVYILLNVDSQPAPFNWHNTLVRLCSIFGLGYSSLVVQYYTYLVTCQT